MCACSTSLPNVSYDRMSASFTGRMHCYSCFLLQRALFFLTAAALLPTCPSVFISAGLECWKTHFISGPWEPALTLNFWLLPSIVVSFFSLLLVSVLFATQAASSLLSFSLFWARPITQSRFLWTCQPSGNFPWACSEIKVGLIILGSIFNLCVLQVWRSCIFFIYFYFDSVLDRVTLSFPSCKITFLRHVPLICLLCIWKGQLWKALNPFLCLHALMGMRLMISRCVACIPL